MDGPKALNKEKTKNTLLRKFLLSAAFLLCCTALANDAVLGPMRFSLAVTPRDDGPYGSSSMNPTPRPKISYMILGDDSSLQPIDGDLQQDDEKTMRAMTPAISLKPRPQQTFIYDLRGRKVNRIQSKQVYIINGKNYIAR